MTWKSGGTCKNERHATHSIMNWRYATVTIATSLVPTTAYGIFGYAWDLGINCPGTEHSPSTPIGRTWQRVKTPYSSNDENKKRLPSLYGYALQSTCFLPCGNGVPLFWAIANVRWWQNLPYSTWTWVHLRKVRINADVSEFSPRLLTLLDRNSIYSWQYW